MTTVENRITFRLPRELKNKLVAEAEKRGVSVSELTSELVLEFMKLRRK